jgi:hypothetical protein
VGGITRHSAQFFPEGRDENSETLGKGSTKGFPPRRGGVKARHRHWIQQSVARAFDPPLRADALCLPLTQGCAPLALGYFRRLPTGADRCAAHGMANMEVHLELLILLSLVQGRVDLNAAVSRHIDSGSAVCHFYEDMGRFSHPVFCGIPAPYIYEKSRAKNCRFFALPSCIPCTLFPRELPRERVSSNHVGDTECI